MERRNAQENEGNRRVAEGRLCWVTACLADPTNMFFEPTTIHHHQQPGLTGAAGGRLIDHALLEPDGFGLNTYRFIDDGAGLLGSSKDIYQID